MPDPTLLTTAALDREIVHLREKLEIRMDGEQRLNEERFSSRDAAVNAALSAARIQIDASDRRASDLKERLDRAEGRGAGQTTIIASMIAVATLVLGLLVYLKH